MKSLDEFRPYQLRALRFLEATPRAYLAAKAGAGKTAVVLALMELLMFDRFEVGATLVVAPKRVVGQWAREARKWACGRFLRFEEYIGPSPARKRALGAVLGGQANVLVVSFEFFPELMQEIKLVQWLFGLVVYDEASRLRNGGRKGSVGWKALNAVSSKTQARIVLMSGSPRPGTAHELFAPVFLLDQGQRLGKTLTGFRADYLEPNKQNRHTGQIYSWRLRAGKERELYDRIADLYFAVAPDLGLPSVTIDRYVQLPAKVEAMANQLMRKQVIDLDELEVTAASQGTVSGKLWQMCQGAVFDDQGEVVELHDEKLQELQEIVEEADGPLIVAYWHTHDLERIQRRFPQAVDITTERGLAQALAGEVAMGLLHPAAAGHGIDGLQQHFADIVWFTIPMSFELYDQANKRIIRSGQKSTVRVWRVIAGNGIVDPAAVQRLAQKEADQDEFFRILEDKAA